jgi:hypothetical protein
MINTPPRLTLLPGGGDNKDPVILDADPGRPYTDNQSIPIETLVKLWDQQPASQPMSLATAMFYLEYTRGAFHITCQGDEYFLVLPLPANLRIAIPGEEFPSGPEGEIG